MGLGQIGLHAGLVRNAYVKGAASECRASIVMMKKYKALTRKFHRAVLLGKLHWAVYQVTNRRGGGVLPDDQ